MQICEWLKTKDEEYIRKNPPDFTTHLNYVSCMNNISRNIVISINLDIKNKIDKDKIINKKINLINLTLKSIAGEYKTIKENPDYAELCVSWISVKSYYIIFNLLLILNYLISGNKFWYNFTHEKINNWFKKCFDDRKIKFNKDLFNTNFECYKVNNVRVKMGSNIKLYDVNLAERVCGILKKIALYQIEDLKRKNNIESFKSKKNKEIRDNFLRNSKVNICEFFYWYRIKANYRDLEFLNKDIEGEKFSEYYSNYYELTISFYNAFKKIINDLSIKRFGEEIF